MTSLAAEHSITQTYANDGRRRRKTGVRLVEGQDMISLLIIGEIWHWFVLWGDRRRCEYLNNKTFLINKQPTCDQTNLLNGLKVGTRIDIKLPNITPDLLSKHRRRRLDSRIAFLAFSSISNATTINHRSLGCFVRWLRVARKEIQMKIECRGESVNWPPRINHLKNAEKVDLINGCWVVVILWWFAKWWLNDKLVIF